MKLRNEHAETLLLTITGYQFPKNLQEKYDANWLNISVKVSHRQGDWQATDPSLLTWEIEEIIAWLKALKQGESCTQKLDFLEPNLSFEQHPPHWRIYFEYESRPSWNQGGYPEKRDLWLAFPINGEVLEQAIAGLQQQLVKFPFRQIDK